MNALIKAVQASFSPTNPSSPRSRQLLPPGGRRKPTVCFSGSEPDSSSSSSSPSEGDKRKQDLLARIAMLQAQKVRLTDFLDERSAYLTQFAEDATAQFDQIGDDALKDLDQATSRIMENLENRMQAFEETAEANRQEIEKKEQLVEELEEKMERDRNEGLFFKNLREKQPPRGARAAEAGMEAKKLGELAREKAGSGARKNAYLALMALLGAAIANAVLASAEVEWRKVAALGFLLLALLAQYVYELQLSSQGEDDQEDSTKNNKNK